METVGRHNQNLDESIARLKKGRAYEDLSTIIVTPTRGDIPATVVSAMMQLQKPMNQPVVNIFLEAQEVGDAYNTFVESVIVDPNLSKFKFVLTIEDDNLPPHDGLLKLFENIKDFDAISGLYWTKGEGGQPMIYGDPTEFPINFRPQVPIPDTIQRCNGIGQGFALFRMGMFKDKSIPRPLFKTSPGGTQDLFFCRQASKRGYRFAVDTRVKVGHRDRNTGIIW